MCHPNWTCEVAQMKKWQYVLLGRPGNRWQLVLNVLAPAVQLGILLWLVIAWHGIPAEIPTNYSAAGDISRYGGRGMLWVVTGIGIVMDLIMWGTEQMPESAFNTGVRMTAQNSVFVLACVHDLMAEMRLAMSLLFGTISGISIAHPARYPGWLVWTVFALSAVPIVRYAVRASRAKYLR